MADADEPRPCARVLPLDYATSAQPIRAVRIPASFYDSTRMTDFILLPAFAIGAIVDVLTLRQGWMLVPFLVTLIGVMVRKPRPAIHVTFEHVTLQRGRELRQIPWQHVRAGQRRGNGIDLTLRDGTSERISFWPLKPQDLGELENVVNYCVATLANR